MLPLFLSRNESEPYNMYLAQTLLSPFPGFSLPHLAANAAKQKQVTFQNRPDGDTTAQSKRDSISDLPTVSEET